MNRFLLSTLYAAVVLGSFFLGRESAPSRRPLLPRREEAGVTAEAVAEAEGVVLYRFSGEKMVVPYYLAVGHDGQIVSLR